VLAYKLLLKCREEEGRVNLGIRDKVNKVR
jgi:hypothetical protein